MTMTFQEFLVHSGFSVTKYSGRNMFSSSCLGVTSSEGTSEGTFCAELLESIDIDSSAEEMSDLIITIAESVRLMKSATLGKGLIFYFPTIEFDPLTTNESVDEYDDDEFS